MDFFEHQEVAKRNTTRLVLLFLLALTAIVLLVYLLALVTLVVGAEMPFQGWWQPRVFTWTTAGVLALVTLGSLWKTWRLGKGGGAIAARLGGRRVLPSSTDLLERRVLNVVEEMAIASGTPVPAVYMLDEEAGINAFAAGHDASDAVIGVTRGTVEKLSRDELQGVVAHEFSHILHGDVGLNLRLIGVVYGIELLALIGRLMVEGGGRGRRRRRGRDEGGLIAVGAALWAIGWIGAVCGNLIRAAVSRQREFLADAAAVQFTRNPLGIAGALKKIGGFGEGSRIRHPARAEVSHMFFGDGLKRLGRRLGGASATHPPLEERIRRVDPAFDGAYPPVAADYIAPWDQEAPAPGLESVAGLAGAAAMGAPEAASPDARATATDAFTSDRSHADHQGAGHSSLLDRLGDPGPEHLAHARRLRTSLPPRIVEASRDPFRARALALALFAADDPAGVAAQDVTIGDSAGAQMLEAVTELRSQIGAVAREARLTLIDMIVATLQELDESEYRGFRAVVERLLAADERLDAAEWVLAGLLLRRLDVHFRRRRPARARYSRLAGLGEHVRVLLDALARVGHGDEEEARRAFEAALSSLDIEGELSTETDPTPRSLGASLDRLAQLEPALKRSLLAACATSISADEVVTAAEAELFRVVSDWLDTPAPPLLPGQSLA